MKAHGPINQCIQQYGGSFMATCVILVIRHESLSRQTSVGGRWASLSNTTKGTDTARPNPCTVSFVNQCTCRHGKGSTAGTVV